MMPRRDGHTTADRCPRAGSAPEKKHRTMRRPGTGFLFLLPSLIVMGVFSFWPILYSFVMSFCRWRIVGRPSWCGLENYARAVRSPIFWTALGNTALYAMVTVPAGLVLALGTALLLNNKLRGRAVYRGVFFFPVLVSMVVIAMIWSWMFSENVGIVNPILRAIGIEPRAWMADPKWAFRIIMAMSVWKGFGYGMVIFLAGLAAIPRSYYEAAEVDGAGPWRRFRHITWPLLRPTTLFVLVTAFIGSFQVFDQVYVMTHGGPGYATTVLVSLIYDEAYVRFRMGYACALSYVLFAIILVWTVIQWFMMRREA